MSSTRQGLALLCDPGGIIVRVLRNDLRLAEAVPGRMLLRLADPGSRSRLLDFLARVNDTGTALNSEWNVTTPAGVATLVFSGAQVAGQLLVVGATSNKLAAELYEDVVRLSNEHTNIVRNALKTSADQADLQFELYNEISRLNNDLVTMQRELAQKNLELERLNREKTRFLSIAAHDLRSPLQAILMQSEFLLEFAPPDIPPQHREFLEGIYTASEFVANLVDDLLDVAKIEAQQTPLNLTVTDLTALVARNLARHQLLAARKQVSIVPQLEQLPPAVVDPAKIEQMLDNLISNAVKFSAPGAQVDVQLAASGDLFRLKIRDEGSGLPLAVQGGIFQPFPQGRSRGTADESSSGLGLMIVKQIVDAHYGEISFETEPGLGTTFWVMLPFQPPEEPA